MSKKCDKERKIKNKGKRDEEIHEERGKIKDVYEI